MVKVHFFGAEFAFNKNASLTTKYSGVKFSDLSGTFVVLGLQSHSHWKNRYKSEKRTVLVEQIRLAIKTF